MPPDSRFGDKSSSSSDVLLPVPCAQAKLVGHLITDPSGAYLTSTYYKTLTQPKEEPAGGEPLSA
jgi:hypothetical protein